MPTTQPVTAKRLIFWIALALAMALTLPPAAWSAAAPADLQQQINRLEARINATLAAINQNRSAVRQISAFSGTARTWFVKLDGKDAEIRAKEAERKAVASESYTTTINRIEAEKRQLETDELNRFQGTEYSYTADGRRIRQALTIRLQGMSLTYTSDSTVTLRRCP